MSIFAQLIALFLGRAILIEKDIKRRLNDAQKK